MCYKSFLVQADTSSASDVRLAIAADWARRFGGRVIGVGAQAVYPLINYGYGVPDGEIVRVLREQAEQNLRQAENRFRDIVQGLPSVWRTAMDTPSRVMVEQARCADLVITSQPRPHFDASGSARIGDLIMDTGLPVLVAPPEHPGVADRRILICWKNTLQARSAISAALPLLRQAEEVLIAAVREDEVQGGHELQDVADRLKLHGVNVAIETQERRLHSVAQDLLAAAKRYRADLIVLGAYAHSRATEWVFGGVTNEMLHLADRPVLLAR
jgi:nucleotide-binding universal stress UspA family protein